MPTTDLAFLDNAGWSPALRTALSIMLSSGFPSYIAWTADLHTLFNGPYQALMEGRPDARQGTMMGALWPEIEETVVSICSQAFAGESTFFEDLSLPITRGGRT